MSRTMWSGSISFGLVNIPVRLHAAVREQRVQFHLLHDQDHARLQRKMVCSLDGKEVHPEHMVRGLEVEPGQYVIVRDAELEKLAPEKSRTIDIAAFVDLDSIDPIYYDRPYYLSPGERAAKPYRLLVDAMTKAKKVGIARFVMREKEYLAALRPVGDALCLCTMHFADEVLPADDVVSPGSHGEVSDKELKMAMSLIESLSTEFDAAKFHDEHRQRVQAMIKRKAQGEEVFTHPQVEEKPHRVVNLMAALEESLSEAKKSRRKAVHPGHDGAHRRRKSA